MPQLLAFLTQITAVWPPRIIVVFTVSPRIIVIVYIAIRIIAKRTIVLLICMQTKIENEHVCVSASLNVAAMLRFFQICRKGQRQGEELLWYLLIHYKQQEQGYLTTLLENSS